MTLDILISSDHGGIKLKSILVSHLKTNGFNVGDLGPYEAGASVDYPDYAAKLANEMQQNNFKGILVCGSGIGMSIAVNRYEFLNTNFLGGHHQKRINKLRNSKILMSPQENYNASG